MSVKVTDDDINRIIAGSVGTAFRTAAEALVGMRFRSVHYKSSNLICDCIVANSVLNDKITPHSADGILQCLHRANRAFYSSVDNAYFPIEDKFIEYAKSVLGEDYDKVRALDLRTTCFIAYVLSLDFSRRKGLDHEEILRKAYSYDEFVNGKLPHY